MLKIRVLPTLLFKEVGLVKGVAFDSWRRVGSAMQAIQVYNMRDVDELAFFDIAATAAGRGPDLALVDELADECFMPLTVGGGVRSVEDIGDLLRAGADKVAVNTAAVRTPELVRQAAATFGAQCVVVSIDVRRAPSGRPEVWIESGRTGTGLDPAAWAQEAERRGAGEIILTSIDRDGTMSGYDLELVRSVCEAVAVPVIASGGAGCYEDLRLALTEGKASAVAAASIFHFTHQTPRAARDYLAAHGLPVRA